MMPFHTAKYNPPAIAIIALICLLLFPLVAMAAPIKPDESSAIIIGYQRIGDDSPSQGSLSLDQFKEHIRELKTGGYNVLPLPQIVETVKSGKSLPAKTVGLTFDGAYTATMNVAVPLLKEAELPFTVFFASDMANSGAPGHMTWKELKKLKQSPLVSLGILSSAYEHIAFMDIAQSLASINKAISRYREELSEAPAYFAYPYGEYSTELKKQLGHYAFTAAFGQHSGGLHSGSDFMALPRFMMTENFGNFDRFQLTANALPLPVTDVIPADTIVKENPPMIGFTVSAEISDISKLSCFMTSIGKIKLHRPVGSRVEIRLDSPLEGRTRLNCTLPDQPPLAGQVPVWRWFGILLTPPSYDDSLNASQDPESETPGNE